MSESVRNEAAWSIVLADAYIADAKAALRRGDLVVAESCIYDARESLSEAQCKLREAQSG